MNKLTDRKNSFTNWSLILHFCVQYSIVYIYTFRFTAQNSIYIQLCNFSFVNIEIRCFCQFRSQRFESCLFSSTLNAKEKNRFAPGSPIFFSLSWKWSFSWIVFSLFIFSLNRKTLSDLSTRSFYRRSHKILSSFPSSSFCSLASFFVLMVVFFVSRSMRSRWKFKIQKRRERNNA